MENETKEVRDKSEILKFVFISILFFLGFCIIYFSKVNLNSIIELQAKLLEIFILGVQQHSTLEVLSSIFIPLLLVFSAILIFCFALTFLSIKKLANLKYFLIIPILCSGVLFNFSILFLFFAFGLYLVAIYSISLGEIYKLELKRWKRFRLGSNVVSKSLFILFLFIFLGSFISFSFDNSYKQIFLNTTLSSVTNIVNAEVSNFNTEISNTTIINQMVKKQMEKIREQYPNLTEEEYSKIESEIRRGLEEQYSSLKLENNINLSSVVSKGVENSIILKSFLIWFPLIMSFTIWVFLEFFRSLLFSPLSGVFSFILLSIEKEENK